MPDQITATLTSANVKILEGKQAEMHAKQSQVPCLVFVYNPDCGHCIKALDYMVPFLKRLAISKKNSELKVLGVNTQRETDESSDSFLSKNNVNFTPTFLMFYPGNDGRGNPYPSNLPRDSENMWKFAFEPKKQSNPYQYDYENSEDELGEDKMPYFMQRTSANRE